MDALSPSPRALFRWGQGLILAVFGLALLITVVLGMKSPVLALAMPLAIAAAIGGWLLFQHHRLNFILWLMGFPLLLSSDAGFQIQEIVYGLYFFAFLGHWYARRVLLYRRRLVEDLQDRTVMLWLVLGLGLGTILGVIFGADTTLLRGEILSSVMLALYFPIKEFCAREKDGPVIVFLLLAWIGVFVTLNNAFATQQQFANATEVWQIADVRTAGRELILMFSIIFTMAAVAGVRDRKKTVILLLLLAVVVAGMILTKSRSYWVACAFGSLVLVVLLPRTVRRRFVGLGLLSGVLLLGIAALTVGPYLNLLIVGIVNRILTLNASGTDISLLNRFVESAAVRERIWANPILGYGLGTPYSYFRIIEHATKTYSYIHNGYLAVWYKLGVWGLLLVGTTWVRAIWNALKVGRAKHRPLLEQTLGMGTAACLIGVALPTYVTNVFFEDEKLAAFTIAAAMASGLYQRMRREEHLQGRLLAPPRPVVG